MTSFFNQNGYNVLPAVADRNTAHANNLSYITCYNHPSNPVILINDGNETKITVENNCFNVEVANCEILNAVEKLQVQSIIDAKERS